MAARRLILVMLVLLVLSSILAALVPVERNRLRDSSTTETTTAAAPPPSGELLKRTLAADDPTPERIRLALGDQLELAVTSAKLSDQVEVPAFGQLEDVDPDFAAHFDLLALERGSFAVRLVEADRVIARIEVGPAAPQGGGKRSESATDSPGSSTRASTSGASSAS